MPGISIKISVIEKGNPMQMQSDFKGFLEWLEIYKLKLIFTSKPETVLLQVKTWISPHTSYRHTQERKKERKKERKIEEKATRKNILLNYQKIQ